jgi:pimeloyl-ACP methyl ester carboxylesterase
MRCGLNVPCFQQQARSNPALNGGAWRAQIGQRKFEPMNGVANAKGARSQVLLSSKLQGAAPCSAAPCVLPDTGPRWGVHAYSMGRGFYPISRVSSDVTAGTFRPRAKLEGGASTLNTSITRRHAIGLLATAPALLSEPSRAGTDAVDETGFARIGGIDQWIGIQGRDVRNPAILYLHGGPGEAQSPFLREFIPWEADFTVVNWDQRGSGRTYGKNGPATPGMSTPNRALEQLSQDARDVAEYARKRLAKKKIILVGQSWGAELGLHVVKRWPGLFYAFVGTGQPVSWHLKIEAQERWARERATAAGDRETLQALDDTASLPESDQRRIAASGKYRMAPSDLEHVRVFEAFVGPPPLPTQGEAADWIAGSRFTFTKLAPVEYSLDARKLGRDFPIPFFGVFRV